MVAHVPAIPNLPASTPRDLQIFLGAVKSALDVLTNTSGSAVVTQDDLNLAIESAVSSAVTQSTTVINNAVGGLDDSSQDTTTPTTPNGLVAVGGFSNVILTWDTIPASPTIAFTNIYRAAVDDFSQAALVGTARARIYADYVPDSAGYYYWITFTSEAGIESDPNDSAGTFSGASLDPTYTKEVLTGAITDAQIATIGADKIVAATLAAFTANLGTVTAGLLQSPDETFKVDLSNKEIVITGPGGQVADDYTRIRNGAIESYEWNGSTHVLAKALRGLAAGVASNGDTVTLNGNYFRQQPKVIVSPASLQVYDESFPSQNQTIQCEAQNLVETTPGSGLWEFDAVATLVIADGTAEALPGLGVNDSASDSIVGSAYTTASSDVTKIAVGVRVRSYRGTGTSGQFYYRDVDIQLQTSPVGAGTWTTRATKTVTFGATTDYVSTTLTSSTLAAAQYDVRLVFSYANTSGTFGSTNYTEKTHTTSPGQSDSVSTSSNGGDTGSVSLPAFSPPAGSIIKSVEYQWTYDIDYSLVSTGFGSNASASVVIEGSLNGPFRSVSNGNTNNDSFTGSDTDLQTTSSYDPNLSWDMNLSLSGGAFGTVDLAITNAKATITYDEPDAGDSGTHNFYEWDTITTTLSASQQLATGTLNWLAIGAD